MTVEEIAIRREIRQMLNEAGFNKDSLKVMVKEVLEEELKKACMNAMNESNVKKLIEINFITNFDRNVKNIIRESIQERINGYFNRMYIKVDITDKSENSIIE